jgi:hypothetical protein
MTAPDKIRVGVTIYIRKGFQSLWENGIYQNCLFLIETLRLAPHVGQVYLVMGGGEGDLQDARRFLGELSVPMIGMNESLHAVDVMIEMSALLDPRWGRDFRARGGKIVTMRVGNDYVIDVERMVFDKPAGFLITGIELDEIWTLPEYESSGKPYFGSALRAPVRIMPHLWSPDVIEQASRRLPEGQYFGYQPGRKRWRVGIFEPNICMVKTCQIPMLVADCAHRQDPDQLEKLWVYNALTLKQHPVFLQFARSLDVVQHGMAYFAGRFPVYELLARDVDALITHHWENGQNYLYYEALYGGYPLIHNSNMVGGCGYYYPEFDCETGGQVLLQAKMQHDLHLAGYLRQARQFLRTLHPAYHQNVEIFDQALMRLYDQSTS